MSKEKVPLGTTISADHRAKIDELVKKGLSINAIVEQGIDAVYDQFFKAGLVKNGVTICDDCGATITNGG